MKRLSKDELKQRDQIAGALEKARDNVCDRVDDYNAKVQELWQPVEDALTAYNDLVTEAQNFRDEIISRMEDYIGERSERWQEGDAGSAYADWKDQWEALSIELMEVDQPEGIDLPEVEGPEALRDVESELAA